MIVLYKIQLLVMLSKYGLKEMEQLRYFYSVVALLIYFSTISLCTFIVYVVWTEQSLHEPMYIFICNLVGNNMVGSSAILPKLSIDLLSRCTTISPIGCLAQAFCIQTFGFVEILTFTIMAYDRYLAVGFPLRYHSLMTNKMAIQSLAIILAVILIFEVGTILLVVRLTLCGNNIQNVFCETMSLNWLTCSSTVIINIYGTIFLLLVFIGSLIIVIYCYIQTFLVCLKISMEASQKAIHTLWSQLPVIPAACGSSRLEEMEQLRYFYSAVALLIYLKQSLHEPKYIFIFNLVGNNMVGSSAILPKLSIDLLSGCTTISPIGCLTQAFCIQTFGFVEILTFTIRLGSDYVTVRLYLRL
ncbi:olfactory receptor 1496-like [Dendropsophus ebraccatus]|uniref:olfactory receptor 1496-like n=1 Tax=Dendropsophus ebraccatus TaxID=150705 RepID=UPI003832276B